MARPCAIDRWTPYRDARARVRAFGDQSAAEFEAWRAGRRRARPVAPLFRSATRDAELEARRLYRSEVEEAEAVDGGRELATLKRQRVLGAIWRRETGPAPECKPGDRAAARAYAERLQTALDRHSQVTGDSDSADATTPLTRNEAAYLRGEIRRWLRRADGTDARFERLGTKRGRERERRTL